MLQVENGNTVSVHYRGTLNDGTEFDSSHGRGEPLSFQVGTGQMISGFDAALPGMAVGETKNIMLTPDQAYGDSNPEAITDVPKTSFPNDFNFQVDAMVQGQNDMGQPVVGTINEVKDEAVTIDFNHPMAGKDLNFEIELVSID
jgi:FKBP-type peptidyl-prolyl cis-trans isomerase 2